MPKFSDQIVRRFAELEVQGNGIPMVRDDEGGLEADDEKFNAWSAGALAAIWGTFGKESPHYARFLEFLSSAGHTSIRPWKLAVVRGLFLGAKSDVDGDHLFDLQRSVSGEIFGDFVEAAKVALAEDRLAVAGVLACAALEDALKRFATSKDLSVEGQTMEQVVNALKSKGLVSGAQKTLLSAMPKIRNRALHAEWTALTVEDVRTVIGCVEQFLLANF